jgi:hypothetical protein
MTNDRRDEEQNDRRDEQTNEDVRDDRTNDEAGLDNAVRNSDAGDDDVPRFMHDNPTW